MRADIAGAADDKNGFFHSLPSSSVHVKRFAGVYRTEPDIAKRCFQIHDRDSTEKMRVHFRKHARGCGVRKKSALWWAVFKSSLLE